MGKTPKAVKKGKKDRKPKRTSARHKLYEKGERKNKFCPKCGAGVFLAKHKDRQVCGQCGYAEFSKE